MSLQSMLVTSVSIIAGVVTAGIGLLFAVCGFVSRTEEEYWQEFWATTPTTEGASDVHISNLRGGWRLHSLKKAA